MRVAVGGEQSWVTTEAAPIPHFLHPHTLQLLCCALVHMDTCSLKERRPPSIEAGKSMAQTARTATSEERGPDLLLEPGASFTSAGTSTILAQKMPAKKELQESPLIEDFPSAQGSVFTCYFNIDHILLFV